MGENRSHDTELVKMDVTPIDAFKIKEINLLIASYVFAMCHNMFVLKSQQYTGQNLSEDWYTFGSIVGVVLSGVIVDVIFKKQRFLTILILNSAITIFDVYLYTQTN